MKQFKQQKITVLEDKLTKKIQHLEDEIKKLPAYARRKKDEKNWKNFFTFFAFSALVGIVIFGTGGWLAVAVSGTLLTLIIVEAGLLSSLAIGFSAWPIYNAYLWIRDLFSSEKIKNQNKDYHQCRKSLIELKRLAAEKSDLMAKINAHLKNAIQYFPSKISQEKVHFAQLDLKDQIQQLEQQKKKFPAHIRKQKDKHIWNKIFQYSAMTSCASLALYAAIMAGVTTSSILLGPVFPALVIIEATIGLLIVGPVTVCSVLYTSYFGIRNFFSSAEIKNENKQYARLEKTINTLKKLDEQQSQSDENVKSKLECVECIDGNSARTTHTQEIIENHSEIPKNAINKYVYRLLQKPAVPGNQATVAANLSSTKSNIINP